MLKMLAQRSAMVDKAGQLVTPWFTLLADLVRTVNAKRVTAEVTAESVTGTTDETTAATIPVVLGTRGIGKLTLALSMTANANAKTVRVKLGSTTVQTYTLNNASSGSLSLMIVGTGKATQTSMTTAAWNVTPTGGITNSAEDMSGSITITVTLQLGTSTDTIALESWALDVEQN